MDKNRKCYAVKNKNETVRANSRSGGIFTAISDWVLDNGGVVYGCVMSDVYTAEHIRATAKSDRDRMRGSKYIPSRINNCYSLCAEDLSNGKQVLFSGTPCQIDALNNFLSVKKTDTTNLLTMDLICHAVASPKLWQKYLDHLSKGKKIDSVDFRDKKNFGWGEHKETIVVEGKEISSKGFSDIYYSNLAYPLHCFKCYYKNCDRVSDITIGDYWGIDRLDPENFDNKGISLVILNSEKGNKAFSSCANELEIKEYYLIDSLQPPLVYNYTIPKNRNRFYNSLDNDNFDTILKKFVVRPKIVNTKPDLLYSRIVSLAKKIIKSIKR